MANSVNIQVLENGPRNYVVRAFGILDTADIPLSDLVDVTAAAFTAPGNKSDSVLPTGVALKKVTFNIEDGLTINTYWDATADTLLGAWAARGKQCFDPPVKNNSGAGKTGKVLYSSTGFAGGAVAYDVLFHFIKKFT